MGRCPGLVCCCPFRAKKNNIRLYEKRILFTGNFGYTQFILLTIKLLIHIQTQIQLKSHQNVVKAYHERTKWEFLIETELILLKERRIQQVEQKRRKEKVIDHLRSIEECIC